MKRFLSWERKVLAMTKNRLEAFSDGVFAIVITLLIEKETVMWRDVVVKQKLKH
jgi:hypothetical protein